MPGKTFDSRFDHVGVGELAQRNQADVLGHVGVGGAGPLAIDDAMEVVGVRRVGRLHDRADPVSDETVRQLSDSARGRNRRARAIVRCSSNRRAPANVKWRPRVNSDGLFCDGRHIRQAFPLIGEGLDGRRLATGMGIARGRGAVPRGARMKPGVGVVVLLVATTPLAAGAGELRTQFSVTATVSPRASVEPLSQPRSCRFPG